MPDLDTHCRLSRYRMHYNFERLHEWIDGKQDAMGLNHRLSRHAYNKEDEQFIKAYWDKEKGDGWGEKAVIEWLFHLAIDNLDTAFKKAKSRYKEKAFNFFAFGIGENGYIYDSFDRKTDKDLEELFIEKVYENE